MQPVRGPHLLQDLRAVDAVSTLIRDSTSAGRDTAIRCRFPLVLLSDVADGFALRHPHDWPAFNDTAALSTEVRELSRLVWEVAWGASRLDMTLPQIQFGLSRPAAEGLRRLALRDLLTLSSCGTLMLRLRAHNQPIIWDRLLIGNRFDGPRAARIARHTAMMSMSLDA
jgi:hypothetical protein